MDEKVTRLVKLSFHRRSSVLSHQRTDVFCLCSEQKADGTCNTNFKKTKHREQVKQALVDFVDGNIQILVCVIC